MRSFACSVILSAVLLVPLAGCADDAETNPGTTAGASGTGAGASGKSGSSGHSTGGKSGASGKGGGAGAGDVGGSGGDAGSGDTGGTSAGVAGASGKGGAAGASAGGANAGAGAGGAGAAGASAGAGAGGSEAGGTESGGTDAGGQSAGGTDAGSGGAEAGGTDGGAGAGTGGTESAGGAAGASAAGSDSAGGSGGAAAGAAGTDAGGAAGTDGGSGSSGQAGGPGQRLRIMASNLTSGTKQTYEDPGPGLRILKGSHPDVVLMQEFNYGANTTAAIATLTEYVLGEPGHFYRESLGQSGSIPNGIISRHPIVASGSWVDKQVANRQFAWARIAIPGAAHDLWAVSVHLLTKNESTRNTQAKALVDLIAANVPADDYLVLGGDFNTDVRTETCVTTFGSQLVVGPLFPLDMAGNGNTSVKRNKPYDWVLGDSDLDKLAIPVVIGANVFPGGFVADTKSYTPISDLAPALPTDSLDTVNGKPTYMQHLGVVRDFWIPKQP